MNAAALHSYWRGKRVQLSPHLDRWMRGDRYGAVVDARKTKSGPVLSILMDRSGDIIFLSDTSVTESE